MATQKEDKDLMTAVPPVAPVTTDKDQPAKMHWTILHSAAVFAITGLFVWMAVWIPWGLYTSWIVVMLSLTIFTLIVGRGVTGVWKGAFIDERLRVSLSRLQLFVWTVVIVAAFATIAVARAQADPANSALTALSIAVPETIWALLGISVTSLIGSPLIKKSKADAPTDQAKANHLMQAQGGANASRVTNEGAIVKNRSIHDASLADLFMGEYVDNFTLLDIGKIQMFFFTLLLVLAYASAISQLLQAGPIPDSLPDIGSGMLPLLGISHAGYLMTKVASAPATERK